MGLASSTTCYRRNIKPMSPSPKFAKCMAIVKKWKTVAESVRREAAELGDESAKELLSDVLSCQ